MTDKVEVCDFPSCYRPAVGHLMRPFVGDRVALCKKHELMALALMEELAEIEQEREKRPDDDAETTA